MRVLFQAYQILWNHICLKWWLYSNGFIDLPHTVSTEVKEAQRISIYEISQTINEQ